MKLEPLFKTKGTIKAKNLTAEEKKRSGFKQGIVDTSGKILIGRNHAYSMPVWFEEIASSVNSLLNRDKVDTVEVWIATEGFPRGVIVGIKNGKPQGRMRVFGNLSEKTLKGATYAKQNGWKAFNY